MVQVAPVVVDHAGAVGRRDEELFDVGGSGEAQDGAAAEAEWATEYDACMGECSDIHTSCPEAHQP
ncbi:hypothetical protein [Kitasatospora sp. NPDC090091]|uniref:hypothetical protein n=1 Tax=Kitasatospora sp. NPDC090091 TaxID=3364081 RepID=UPI0037F4498B